MHIGIIVDHPSRDLPQLVNLSEEIIKINNNFRISLLPMYHTTLFCNLNKLEMINRNKPIYDILIFNFFRNVNIRNIKIAKESGAKIIIYDQEGAGGNTGKNLINLISIQKKFLPLIDNYYFWGKEQFLEFKKKINKKFYPKNVKVVGWLHLDSIFRKKKYYRGKKYVLINTNFPACDPRFNSLQKDIAGRMKLSNASYEKILNSTKILRNRKDKFLSTINYIMKKHPNEKFKLRPHPFEKDDEYILLSKKFKNCQIDYSEDLTKTLFDVKLFLHVDCTTAVRTNLLNIPTISLDWLIKNKKKDPYNKISNDISYKCNNIIKLNR